MSNNLDKKLKKLSREYGKYYGSLAADELELIEAIKQAFIDDGWVKPLKPATDEEIRKAMGKGELATIDYPMNVYITPLCDPNGLLSKDEWERQAIKDGWVKQISFLDIPESDRPQQPDWVARSPHIMRGDEFYLRFTEKLELAPAVMDLHLLPGKILMDIEDVKEAAKKAAGIE